MRSNLKNGKLIPPTSFAAAVERHRTLVDETARILSHISDASRRSRFETEEAYSEWRESARRAFKTFRAEQRQLSVWIDFQNSKLFRQAYELLKQLQEEDVTFEDKEQDLIDRLDAHFGVAKNEQLKETA